MRSTTFRSPAWRLVLAAGLGLLAGLLAVGLLTIRSAQAADLDWPLCGARALLRQADPYRCPHVFGDGSPAPSNPLTTAAVLVPLAWLPDRLVAALLVGLAAALITWGSLRRGEPWRLLVFVSWPYVHALYWAQWAPLLYAVWLLPTLLPLTLVKPQIGLPLALSRLTWRRALACALFGLLTLAYDPTWPLRWLPQTRGYTPVITLLLLPLGPLLALLLLRWRDPRARLLLTFAALPLRAPYDLVTRFAVATGPWQTLGLVAVGWLSVLLGFGIEVQALALDLLLLGTVLWPRRLPAQTLVLSQSETR